jgi:hypothetical protein
MTVAFEMQRLAFHAATEGAIQEDEDAANEATARSQPPYGVSG